ncbi:MAG: peptidylprolyl isomerase, partial [Candidatus Saccharibacteria bacterium]
PLSQTLKKTLPAYVSGFRYASIYDRDQAVGIGLKLDSKLTPPAAKQAVIANFRRETLFHKLGLALESDELSDELTFLTRGKQGEYEKLLKDYFGGDEETFTKYVVYPAVVDKKLRMYYAHSYSSKEEGWDRAYGALSTIKSGDKTFEQVAREESDDKFTGQFGGDLGFFEHGQALPELEKIAVVSPLGKVYPSIVESRLGYHIIYPVEVSYADGKKLWHVKHILYATKGYDAWLNSSLDGIRILTLSN